MTETTAPAGVPAPSLQIIGAGFGRTGTMSMRLTLVRLGFGPCDHMLENLEHPERLALWDVALRHKLAGQPMIGAGSPFRITPSPIPRAPAPCRSASER